MEQTISTEGEDLFTSYGVRAGSEVNLALEFKAVLAVLSDCLLDRKHLRFLPRRCRFARSEISKKRFGGFGILQIVR